MVWSSYFPGIIGCSTSKLQRTNTHSWCQMGTSWQRYEIRWYWSQSIQGNVCSLPLPLPSMVLRCWPLPLPLFKLLNGKKSREYRLSNLICLFIDGHDHWLESRDQGRLCDHCWAPRALYFFPLTHYILQKCKNRLANITDTSPSPLIQAVLYSW